MLISKLDNADADTDASKLLPDADAACRGHQRGFSTPTISSQNKSIIKKVRKNTESEIIAHLVFLLSAETSRKSPLQLLPFPRIAIFEQENPISEQLRPGM